MNALDVSRLQQDADSYYVIASGGDDNAISLHVIHHKQHNDDDSEFELCSKLSLPSYHASQIVDVRLSSNTCNSDVTMLTLSIDQRLICWRVGFDGVQLASCDMITSKFVHVADPSTLCVRGNRVVVTGIGLWYGEMKTTS